MTLEKILSVIVVIAIGFLCVSMLSGVSKILNVNYGFPFYVFIFLSSMVFAYFIAKTMAKRKK